MEREVSRLPAQPERNSLDVSMWEGGPKFPVRSPIGYVITLTTIGALLVIGARMGFDAMVQKGSDAASAPAKRTVPAAQSTNSRVLK